MPADSATYLATTFTVSWLVQSSPAESKNTSIFGLTLLKKLPDSILSMPRMGRFSVIVLPTRWEVVCGIGWPLYRKSSNRDRYSRWSSLPYSWNVPWNGWNSFFIISWMSTPTYVLLPEPRVPISEMIIASSLSMVEGSTLWQDGQTRVRLVWRHQSHTALSGMENFGVFGARK